MDLQEAGKRIQKLRKQLGLTQEQLAEKAGVSAHFIYEQIIYYLVEHRIFLRKPVT